MTSRCIPSLPKLKYLSKINALFSERVKKQTILQLNEQAMIIALAYFTLHRRYFACQSSETAVSVPSRCHDPYASSTTMATGSCQLVPFSLR